MKTNVKIGNMVFSKQKRQANRLGKNQTKATRLAIKQYFNEANKRLIKDKSISDEIRQILIASNNSIKITY
jgi:DNA primase catalytic subunit